MIVVDTRIIVYWLFPGARSLPVDSILTRDSDWRAPHLWQSEFRSAAAGLIRKGGLSIDEAIEKMQTALSFVASESVDPEHVLRLVAESPCTAYDLEFVALA